MFKIDINSEEDCYSIYNNCKNVWKSDGTTEGNINFLVDYYPPAEDFPVTLKYNSKFKELSFEDFNESTMIKYTREFKSVTKLIDYIKAN
jgi:hypothetical protein